MTEEEREAIVRVLEIIPDERTAIELVESRRWPAGIVCPYCESERTTRQRSYQYHQCKDCRRKFTCRTNTIFERSHIPMQKWLLAIFLLEKYERGISSTQLAKVLGITQKSAWFMLVRLKEVYGLEECVSSGEEEDDDTSIVGGSKDNRVWDRYFVKRKAKRT
ncbi:MAG: IS1595 family transposase [Chloroflexi bacterium]|nr:IS1595 family transposase [Chloroflexota bacterium]